MRSAGLLTFFLSLLSLSFAKPRSFTSGPYVKRNSTGLTDEVTWDPRSLSIQGQRTFILSAEVHPWRSVPGNAAQYWADVFQKIASNGFNTVSFYVNWATHYPAPDTNGGLGDFEEGTYRDIQLFIDEAKKAGLWLIARPGPYINAETTGGGFPGWVGNIAGDLRTNNPNFTDAWTPYFTEISKIIAKNQITNGGPIILVQAENEFSEGDTRSPYMQQVIDVYRENGVVVPITHNDQHSGQTGNFSPDRPGTGRVNIYCGDSYPQGSNSWSQVQTIYWSAHENVAPNNPLCLAEFGGGFLLNWGSVARGGTGYEKFSANLTTADYENVFYKDTYAQTATILNVYMLFGGTNWGQTAAPVAYSSYDYGGGINENRIATSKMNEMRLQGLFLRVSRDLLGAELMGNGTNYTTSSAVHTSELRNLDTGAAFYIIRQNTSNSLAVSTTRLNVTTSQGSIIVPKLGNITLDGRESKILVTDYKFGASKADILYSTAEIMTWATIGNKDYIILYAKAGQTGETALQFDSAPTVDTSNGSGVSANYSDGTLLLNYKLSGSQFVNIVSDTSTTVIILLEKDIANQWHSPIIPAEGNYGNFFSIGTNQSVLVGGPYLIRSANIENDTLNLVGDLNGTTSIELIAPDSISKLSWNGESISAEASAHGSLTGTISVNTPTISLPELSDWVASGSLPEIDPGFDDSSFITANQTSTNYTNLPPLSGDVVLYSQQYGFYGGNLIFRGHFNASGDETAVRLAVQGGFAFGYTAWLNGVFLGSNQGNATVSMTDDTWRIPEGALSPGQDNVVTVLQDHMGISETSTNGGKEPRGIRGYAIVGGNTSFSDWKIQGNEGGAAGTPDTFRGYLNEGGLYGERVGAHLPGFPDSEWVRSTPLDGLKKAGVNFYRTTFDLDIPDGYDIPIRLSVTSADSTTHFRAQIYINGWQFGKVNDIGPQTLFVLPASILRQKGTNTLVLSLWALDADGVSIGGLQLVSDGEFASALTIADYTTSDYGDQKRPSAQFFDPM